MNNCKKEVGEKISFLWDGLIDIWIKVEMHDTLDKSEHEIFGYIEPSVLNIYPINKQNIISLPTKQFIKSQIKQICHHS